MTIHVRALEAPGFDPEVRGTVVEGLEAVGSSDQGPLTVIVRENGDFLAVPARYIEVVDDTSPAARYQAEWSVKTGRNARDIYVPEALR